MEYFVACQENKSGVRGEEEPLRVNYKESLGW